LYTEQYPTLVDLLVGDTIDLEITARVTDIDEEGRHGLELMVIKVLDKNDVRQKAKKEIINIGTLSTESLDALFMG